MGTNELANHVANERTEMGANNLAGHVIDECAEMGTNNLAGHVTYENILSGWRVPVNVQVKDLVGSPSAQVHQK